jgi:hypothetical protein
MEQLAIALTGGIAIWLVNDRRESWRRYACLFGFAGQPFWIHATYTAGSYGMLALTLLYTVAWARGVWTNWIKTNRGAGDEMVIDGNGLRVD